MPPRHQPKSIPVLAPFPSSNYHKSFLKWVSEFMLYIHHHALLQQAVSGLQFYLTDHYNRDGLQQILRLHPHTDLRNIILHLLLYDQFSLGHHKFHLQKLLQCSCGFCCRILSTASGSHLPHGFCFSTAVSNRKPSSLCICNDFKPDLLFKYSFTVPSPRLYPIPPLDFKVSPSSSTSSSSITSEKEYNNNNQVVATRSKEHQTTVTSSAQPSLPVEQASHIAPCSSTSTSSSPTAATSSNPQPDIHALLPQVYLQLASLQS